MIGLVGVLLAAYSDSGDSISREDGRRYATALHVTYVILVDSQKPVPETRLSALGTEASASACCWSQNVRRYTLHPRHTAGGSSLRSCARKARYAGPFQTSAKVLSLRAPSVARSAPITMQHGCTRRSCVMYALVHGQSHPGSPAARVRGVPSTSGRRRSTPSSPATVRAASNVCSTSVCP